jgi:DNA-binding transcriptional regulator YiaG
MTGTQLRNIRRNKLFKLDRFGFNVCFSQSDLAQAIGRGYQRVMAWEALGDKPIPDFADKLVRDYCKSQNIKP